MSVQPEIQKSSDVTAAENQASISDACLTTTSPSDSVVEQKKQSHQNPTEATSTPQSTKDTSCESQTHPIRLFIDELFANKEKAKRQQWANFFIKQEYDEIDQLKELSEEDWNRITLPGKIVSVIRKKLKEGQKSKEEIPSKVEVVQQKKEEKLQSPVQKLEQEKPVFKEKQKPLKKEEKVPEDDGKLTSEDKMQLSEYLNEGLSQKQILKFFRVVEGSPKGNAILLEIKSLMKPPKPEPQGCQRVGVKLNQKALPLFLYRGKKLQFTKYYTLLVVGETGSGKTTLLDAFVNKLTGMEFTDNWRWKLVNEDHLKDVPPGSSQTSEITTYYINDVNNRFNIRIIDTPGFGDTKGLAVDDQTVNKFDSLFNTISEIDYVLLTVKASETRLKPGSKYVYNRVEQIFGVDAKDRFILMCTFAEGEVPLCVETFQKDKLHFDKYFPFNNSAIYVPSVNSKPTTQFFWKMAISSIQAFEDYIIAADKSPLSLRLSREVLEARKYLEQSIKTSQSSIIDTSKQLDVAKMNLTNWKRNKKQIEQNGQYTIYETRTTFPYTNLGKTVQMCNICKITCCQVCQWPANSTYSACTYFNGGNGCPKCPGKCSRYSHVRTTDYIQKVTETVPVVINCKKQAFEQGVTLEQKFKNDLKKNEEKIRVLANAIWHHGTEIKSNLKKLEQIALQPKMWTDEDFYQQMIAQEEDQRQDGWVQRVKYLKDTLARMKNCKELVNAASIEDIFPELKNLKKDAENQSSSSSCEIY